MPKWLKEILTLSNNTTYDTVRVLAVFSFVQFLSSEAIVLYKTGVFDAQSFGIGLGAVIAGVGVALKFNPDNGGNNGTV